MRPRRPKYPDVFVSNNPTDVEMDRFHSRDIPTLSPEVAWADYNRVAAALSDLMAAGVRGRAMEAGPGLLIFEADWMTRRLRLLQPRIAGKR